MFALADSPQFWAMDGAGNNEGPYLGGFQPEGSPEPAGGWQWVTGEAWSYTSWMSGEPNNWGGEEDFLCYFAIGGARTDRWNDVGDSASAVHSAYVVEVVPEPATAAVLGLGVIAAARRRKGA